MKKLINQRENVVEEMLQGFAVLSPSVARLSGHKVMLRADADAVRDRQVAIISGGGSGHEPAHAGYIGAGMLSAALQAKSSPPRTQIPSSPRSGPSPENREGCSSSKTTLVICASRKPRKI